MVVGLTEEGRGPGPSCSTAEHTVTRSSSDAVLRMSGRDHHLVTCMNLGLLQTWVQEVTSGVGGRASPWRRGICPARKVFLGKVVDMLGRESSMGRHVEDRRKTLRSSLVWLSCNSPHLSS